jgi:nucleotide-binding universal stress UspA family protein
MFRHILFATDLTRASRPAAAAAGRLARDAGAALTVLHVYSPPPVALGDPIFVSADSLWFVERSRFEDEVHAWMAHADMARGARAVVAEGDPCREIVARARSLGADLVVTGTHGRCGLERWAMGSVAERVLHAAPCPVMTVAAEARGVCAAGAWPRRILCAESLSHPSRALEYALSLVQESGAELHVVHALEGLRAEWLEGKDRLDDAPRRMDEARARLHRALERAGCAHLGHSEVVRAGRPQAEILRYADERAVDLIIVGVHDRNPLDFVFLGSTAREVVRRAPCPVLAVRGEVVRSLVGPLQRARVEA